MMSLILPLGAILALLFLVVGFIALRARRNGGFSRRIAYVMVALNILGPIMLLILSLVLASRIFAMVATGPSMQALSGEIGLGLIGAGLSTGLAAIGAGIGVGMTGAASIGAIAEKPELLGRSLVFVGLAEGIAIYGLLISILILGRL